MMLKEKKMRKAIELVVFSAKLGLKGKVLAATASLLLGVMGNALFDPLSLSLHGLKLHGLKF